MGLLSDFIVADPHDVPAILKTVNPSAKWESAQFKGLTQVNLCQLWAIIKQSSFDAADLDAFKSFSNSDEGPWAMVVPAELTKRMAAIRDSDAQGIAKQWSQTEELAADRWQPSEVLALLQAVRKLSSSATQHHKSLILWVSL